MSLIRALRRDEGRHDSSKGIHEAYERHYIPGQHLYLHEVKPRTLADVVVDNNDLDRPNLHMKSTP